MANLEGTKEVLYWKYCKTCKHKDLKEGEDPCEECLSEPVNVNCRKPIKWEEA